MPVVRFTRISVNKDNNDKKIKIKITSERIQNWTIEGWLVHISFVFPIVNFEAYELRSQMLLEYQLLDTINVSIANEKILGQCG